MRLVTPCEPVGAARSCSGPAAVTPTGADNMWGHEEDGGYFRHIGSHIQIYSHKCSVLQYTLDIVATFIVAIRIYM